MIDDLKMLSIWFGILFSCLFGILAIFFFTAKPPDESPIILDSREWQCIASDTYTQQTNIQSGNVSVPVITTFQDCKVYAKTK